VDDQYEKGMAMIDNPVKRWMFQKGISSGDIAMITGATKSSVSMTLEGTRIDARVIDFLQKKGCPDILNNGTMAD
jgi:hypothetical protein